jgi:hypothetical protein
LVVWPIVEEPKFVQARTQGKSVYQPSVDFALDQETDKAQADIRSLADVDKPARSVLEFVYSDPQIDEVRALSSSNLEEGGLKVEFLLVDGTRTTISEGIYTALKVDERANMLSVVNIEAQHVSFVEVAIPVRSLSPIIVADLLPHFSGFSTDRDEPIISTTSNADIFDWVPEILAVGRISKKTPVLVLPQ